MPEIRGTWRRLAPLALLAACTVDSEDEGFGNLSTVPAAATPPLTSGDDDGGGEGTATSTGTTSGGTDAGSDSGAPMTSGNDDSGASDGGSTGPPVVEQPDSGMYSHCISVGDCVGLTTCVTAAPDDGYCSRVCANAATDCDPSPGGTAPAACVDFGGQSVCGLDCSGGQACPGGMLCASIGTSMACV